MINKYIIFFTSTGFVANSLKDLPEYVKFTYRHNKAILF